MNVVFFEQLPPSCPPPEALEKAYEKVFRFVMTNPPTKADFLSHQAKGKPCPKNIDPCRWSSCSIFQSKAKALGALPKMKQMFEYLIELCAESKTPDTQEVFSQIGISGKIYDLKATTRVKAFSDDTKSQIVYRDAISRAQKCPICEGLIDLSKSVSWDHKTPIREGGVGSIENGQLVHPYCNSAVKN